MYAHDGSVETAEPMLDGAGAFLGKSEAPSPPGGSSVRNHCGLQPR